MTAGYDDRDIEFGERDRAAGIEDDGRDAGLWERDRDVGIGGGRPHGYPGRGLDVEDPALGRAASGPRGGEQMPVERGTGRDGDHDAELVPADSRADFESRWRVIQAMFVDEPREAVSRANALLDEVVRSVLAGFSERTTALEQRPDADANTEQLRQALRSYRALFDRVLHI